MPSKPRPDSNFVSDNHVLFCGWVLGQMVRAGLPFEPVADPEGNFTNRVHITGLPDGINVTLIIPPPPDDWKLSFAEATS